MLYDAIISNYSVNKSDYSSGYSSGYSNSRVVRKISITKPSQILVFSTTNLAANFVLGRSQLDRMNYEGYEDSTVMLDTYPVGVIPNISLNNSKVFYIGNVAPGTYTLSMKTDDNTNFVSIMILDNALTLTNIRATINTSRVDFTTRLSVKARIDNANSEIKFFKTFSMPRPKG